MKNLMSSSLCLILALTVSTGCGGNSADTDLAPPQTDATTTSAPEVQSFSGEVLETMDAGGYTYVLVGTETEQFWAASNQFKVEVGDRVTVPIESPMANFRSETLDREFEMIYFARPDSNIFGENSWMKSLCSTNAIIFEFLIS